MADPASTLTTVTDLVVKLNAEIQRGIQLSHDRAKAAQEAADAYTKAQREMYGPDWKPTPTQIGGSGTTGGGANPSGLQQYQANEGLNPLSGDVLDAEGFTKGSYKPVDAAAKAYDMQTAADFDELAKRITAAYGGKGDNYMATIFSTLAGFIREGRFSGVIARNYAQAIITNFAAGFSQEAADPTTSPQMRELDSEFLSFIASGRLP